MLLNHLKSHHEQHAGEIFVQQKRHVPLEISTVIPRITNDDMPMQHADFFSNLTYFGIATLDSFGRPWCTLIVGNPNTMIDAVNPFQLNVGVDLAKSDPFLQCLTFNSDTKRFAGVGVDFTNRRRNKVAGVINEFNVRDCSIGMQLLTNENMGNCPKYITVRQLKRIERKEQVVHDQMNAGKVVLDQECRNIINQASTIFLATRHNDQDARNSDLGMNHRGGLKGFVRSFIEGDQSFVILPDYSGNRFYQSLGNVQSDKVAGMVFPNFHTGDVLYITGEAENLYNEDADAIMPRTSLITRIRITGYVLIRKALGLELVGEESFSPYNPPLRYLCSELKEMGQPAPTQGSVAQLISVEKLTSQISTFTFRLSEKIKFKPGGYIILDFSTLINIKYRHMNNGNPQSLNDDKIRTWTISSSPAFDGREFVPTDVISCTIKHVPTGLISSFLHHSDSIQRQVQPRYVGSGGDFSCFDQQNNIPSNLVFVAGGIGITPFLSMVAAIENAKLQNISIQFLFAGRKDEFALLNLILNKRSVTNIKMFDSSHKHQHDQIQVFNRRISINDIPEWKEGTHLYVCGPVAMMKDVAKWSKETGYPQGNVHKESFFF
ncbi:hypothetical protein HDV01_005499 [Terramyces sp. JEL0728]|nr:hypothetical protein HDV01_005499 [Terramyces sp. JEL0728]